MSLRQRQIIKYAGMLGLGVGASNLLPGFSAPSRAALPLTMQLDWKFNVQFAGLLMADHLGLYQDSGLAISLKPWESGMVVPDEVAENPMVIGCAEQNLILS
ncbi:hypothetical protein H6F55_19650, partial [Phormidium sp. FACHB-322]